MASASGFRGNPAAARRRGAVALLGVAAIHLGLYAWLHSSGGWRLNHAASAEPVLVGLRLLPWTEPAARSPANEPRPASAKLRPSSVFGPIRAPTSVRSNPAPDLTASDAPIAAHVDAGATPSASASQASQPPSLNLALPPDPARRANPRNPALDDMRGNTARTTLEQRMAGALDTRVIEEDFGDGRRRIRRGADCVIVQQSRIGQLMPFNEAAARTPSLVGACP